MQKFIQQLRSITLSDTERARLRAALVAHMHENEASPWMWLFHAKRVQVFALSLVIVVGYGSSITLAAEGALPGDILYPIKTRVSEPVVRLITATSPAAFETNLLEKRLEEAETLDTGEKLRPELKEAVREIVHKQSIKAEESVLEEDTQREDINSGEERGNSERALEGVREKHKDILEKLELNLESAREQGKGREEESDHPERE